MLDVTYASTVSRQEQEIRVLKAELVQEKNKRRKMMKELDEVQADLNEARHDVNDARWEAEREALIGAQHEIALTVCLMSLKAFR